MLKGNILIFFIGKLEIKEDNVENLLATAALLQFVNVVKDCSAFLAKRLHPSNCIGIHRFADSQGCLELRRVAIDFISVSARPSRNLTTWCRFPLVVYSYRIYTRISREIYAFKICFKMQSRLICESDAIFQRSFVRKHIF